jgi:hypothetical protein
VNRSPGVTSPTIPKAGAPSRRALLAASRRPQERFRGVAQGRSLGRDLTEAKRRTMPGRATRGVEQSEQLTRVDVWAVGRGAEPYGLQAVTRYWAGPVPPAPRQVLPGGLSR